MEAVTLLERAELSRIAQEQGLATMNPASLLSAGKLAGADGLVLLETRKLAGSTTVTLRLVGVARGIVLGWWTFEVVPEQILFWPEGAVAQIKPLLPKLGLATASTVPISFLGITSPTVSRSTSELERMFNSLLLSRLQAQPDLLVLERQKLLKASFEKMLSADDRKFWTGAYLVQGTLNPEQISSNSLAVRIGLVAPGEGTSREFTLTGEPTHLAALSEQAVAQVKNALSSGSKVVNWDTAGEARRFYEQAEAALQWQFWPEARMAAETALALGKDDLETRRVRLQACVELCRIDRGVKRWVTYTPGVGTLQRYTAPPPQEGLEAALDTSFQLHDRLHDLSHMALDLRSDALQPLITDALEALGRFTLKYYVGAELRRGVEPRLALLRANMRDFIDSLFQTPVIAQPFKPVLRKFGPLWYETPEEGVTLHERLGPAAGPAPQQTVLPGRQFPLGLSDMDWTPKLCGWKWADRSRAEEVWDRFMEKTKTARCRPGRQFKASPRPNYRQPGEADNHHQSSTQPCPNRAAIPRAVARDFSTGRFQQHASAPASIGTGKIADRSRAAKIRAGVVGQASICPAFWVGHSVGS